MLMSIKLRVHRRWDDISFWLTHHFKCNIIQNNLNKLFGFEHFESNAKINSVNCFLLNARFSGFKHKYSNTKPTIKSILHSMKIIESSEFAKSRKL